MASASPAQAFPVTISFDMKLALTDCALRVPRLEPFSVGTTQGRGATALSGGAQSKLALALFSGGDEQVFLDPATGRTKYGTPHGCAEDEIWFSSSTASAISARGYAAVAATWQGLVSGSETLDSCCNEVRNRLTGLFGIKGTQAILAGSGTEAVLISLALARMFCGARIATIIVGCAETGRSVSAAATGLHFLRHATFGEVAAGHRLDGLEDMDIILDTVEIRDSAGALRLGAAIDAELAQKVEAARHDGRDVIIHKLDGSKTGQSAPSLAAIAQLCEAAPGHVFMLADCCQLRCSAAHIQALLARGFLVTLTGSKFAGGPAFAGALLVPPMLMQRLQPKQLPTGLAAYSAQLDWPPMLRAMLPLAFLPAANIGLALRWQAALAEIERFFAWPADLRNAILMRFYEEVAQRVAETPCLDLLPTPAASEASWGHTILGVAMHHSDGRVFDMAEAAAVQRRLREAGHAGNRVAAKCFHLGQPVAIGGAGILRVCASAVLVNHLAEEIEAGSSLPKAFAPIAETLADLFRAWPAVLATGPQ